MLFDQVVRSGKSRGSVSSKKPQGTRLQGPRSRELILTMLLSFSLTFALLLWERKTTAAPPQILASQRPAEVRSEPITSYRVPEQPKGVERTLPAAAAPPRTFSAPEPAEDTNHGGGALPLAFNVYNRRARGKIEGFIKNMSSQPMSIALQVVDASGQATSQAELNLAPGEQKSFGTDSGLDIHSRDRVILRSPPYQDGAMDVP
jgi:hypothetical protein